MTTLAEQHHVQEEFLIPGLFSFLINHFTRISDTASESIDFHSHHIGYLNYELLKPVKERKGQMTDAQINQLVESANSAMIGKAERMRCADSAIEELRHEWDCSFSYEYWRDWEYRRAISPQRSALIEVDDARSRDHDEPDWSPDESSPPP